MKKKIALGNLKSIEKKKSLVGGVKSATVAPSTLGYAEETSGGGYGADQAGNAPRIASLSVLCRFTGASFVCFEVDKIDDGAVFVYYVL